MRPPDRLRYPPPMEIPGLYPPRRRMPRWPVWLWLIVAAVIAIPLVGIPSVVLAQYTTSNSEFCLTCHATGETPDRSIVSDVHPGYDKVSCVDCHAKPDQVVFEGYVKGFMAEPERVSNNCLRCHPDIAERTDVEGFKFNSKGIPIDHKSHIERGATCVSCHSNVAHDLREEKTNRPQMESCYACHQRSQSCVTCHPKGIPPAPASRETVGRKPVVPPVAQPVAQQPAQRPDEKLPSQPSTGSAAPGGGEKNTEEGKQLYARQCAPCHGSDGSALPMANLKSSTFLQGRGVDALVRATAEGKGGMPPFGASKGGPLSDQQVTSIVEYMVAAAGQP